VSFPFDLHGATVFDSLKVSIPLYMYISEGYVILSPTQLIIIIVINIGR
jgi:hypothetical protein